MKMRKIFREESGSAMVEFAVTVSVFLLVFAGIADVAYYIHAETELQDAASAGAYYGTIPGNQTNGTYMQASATAAAPDLSGVTATPTTYYECTPGGTKVSESTSCTNLVNGTAYGTPIMYVAVTTTANVPALLKWTGLSTSLSLKGYATYRVPWI
jgi:Flp pilus assembly protein TadG